LKEPHGVAGQRRHGFGNLLKKSLLKCTVGLHRISLRTTCTALSNTDAVADAMAWLIGDGDVVEIDRSRSFHGPEVVLIYASTSKKRLALDSFARLGEDGLDVLQTTYEGRYDEAHVLHFRLELHALLNGEVCVAQHPGTDQVKGEIKVEVYPGQSPEAELLAIIDRARERAKRLEAVTE
jgi:RNA binding exosome subunit